MPSIVIETIEALDASGRLPSVANRHGETQFPLRPPWRRLADTGGNEFDDYWLLEAKFDSTSVIDADLIETGEQMDFHPLIVREEIRSGASLASTRHWGRPFPEFLLPDESGWLIWSR